MRVILVLLLMLHCVCKIQAQDFTYIGTMANDKEIVKRIADSLHKPILISGNKLYVFDCVGRLLDGDVNDRNKEGDENDRNKDGKNNTRNNGGNIGYRNKNGKQNNRNKGGDADERDNDGDVNARNSDGAIAQGTHCSVSKKGKVILYTREKIIAADAQIFYKDKYFSNRYFKIVQL